MPPSPRRPPILSYAHLARLRDSSKLPAGCWYFIASVALSALNRPDEIPRVLSFALDSLKPRHGHGSALAHTANAAAQRDQIPGDEDTVAAPGGSPIKSRGGMLRSDRGTWDPLTHHRQRLAVARRTREALLKSAAVVGLPKTINALLALKGDTPAELLDEGEGLGRASPRRRGSSEGSQSEDGSNGGSIHNIPKQEHMNARSSDSGLPALSSIADEQLDHTLARGERFFSTVYGKVADRVMSQMRRCGTPDLAFVARVVYGFLLSGGGGGAIDRSVPRPQEGESGLKESRDPANDAALDPERALGAGFDTTMLGKSDTVTRELLDVAYPDFSWRDSSTNADSADAQMQKEHLLSQPTHNHPPPVYRGNPETQHRRSDMRPTPARAAETSFVLIAALIPQDVNPQLKGHLKGALNCGATAEQVRAVRNEVVGICEMGGMRVVGDDAVQGWTEEVMNV